MEVTESSLASALEGFYVQVRVSPDRAGTYEVADADDLAGAVFATLSRMAALRGDEPSRWPMTRGELATRLSKALAGKYAAFRRVEVLKASGIWPGVICHADGTYTLTYDPEAASDR